jgi:hypothetical protein
MYAACGKLLSMMNTETAQAITRIKRSITNLKRIAAATADHEDARAIYFEADHLAEQVLALELDAAPACDEIPAGYAEPIAA